MAKRRYPRRRDSLENFVRSLWKEPAEAMKPDTELIAIDPGDKHVGVAFFATDENGATILPPTWVVFLAAWCVAVAGWSV